MSDANVRVKKGVVGREVFGKRLCVGGKVGGDVLRAEFAKRRGWEEVCWQRWVNGAEMGMHRRESGGGYVSVGVFRW